MFNFFVGVVDYDAENDSRTLRFLEGAWLPAPVTDPQWMDAKVPPSGVPLLLVPDGTGAGLEYRWWELPHVTETAVTMRHQFPAQATVSEEVLLAALAVDSSSCAERAESRVRVALYAHHALRDVLVAASDMGEWGASPEAIGWLTSEIFRWSARDQTTTARPRCLAWLGTGRKQAHDGSAWDAAILAMLQDIAQFQPTQQEAGRLLEYFWYSAPVLLDLEEKNARRCVAHLLLRRLGELPSVPSLPSVAD